MSIKIEKLQGTYTALITPMKKGDNISNPIDYNKLKNLIDFQLDAKVEGLVIGGTTGQSATLTVKEQVNLIKFVSVYVKDKCQIIAGAGSNSTYDAIKLSNTIEYEIGPTTFLHVTGYYNNPGQIGLEKHFTAITENIDKNSNIILYNVPSRTNSNLELETILKLSKNEKIIGIKEASGNINQVKEILKYTNENSFRVLSGEDDMISEMMKYGAKGVISATSNIIPKLVKKITDAYINHNISNDINISNIYQKDILRFVEATFCSKNPIPLAYLFNTELRLPLSKEEISKENIEKLNGLNFSF